MVCRLPRCMRMHTTCMAHHKHACLGIDAESAVRLAGDAQRRVEESGRPSQRCWHLGRGLPLAVNLNLVEALQWIGFGQIEAFGGRQGELFAQEQWE